MRLENIVPTLEDCRRIPAEAFKDSALVWRKTKEHKERFDVFPRECGECSQYSATSEVYPAPTHEEICMDINRITGEKIVTSCWGGFWIVSVRINGDSLVVRAQNPATAALKLWMMVKGVQG